MVDVCRDARWGRIMEGAGEDPYLNAQVAVAKVKGFHVPWINCIFVPEFEKINNHLPKRPSREYMYLSFGLLYLYILQNTASFTIQMI